VLAINIDLNNPERARAFLDDIGVEELKFYSDPTSKLFSDLKKQGLAFGLPVTLLVDEHGCRIGSVNGPAEWDSEDAKAMIGAAIGGVSRKRPAGISLALPQRVGTGSSPL
jgi:hypothetical protein